MKRQLRMTWFQVKQFASVQYFVQLLIVSTTTAVVVQALAYRAWGGNPNIMWVRGGIIGMWTVTTCAAGILGFERYKGTFVYMVSARIDARLPMAAVISAASTFGLAALPLAWVLWLLFTGSTGFVGAFSFLVLCQYVLGAILLWASCLAVAFVIASVFVLSPNAIAYESLLLTPVMITSGILFTQDNEPGWLQPLSAILPIHWPIALLLQSQIHQSQLWLYGVLSLITTALWGLLAWFLGGRVIRRACRDATLEVM